MNNITIVNLRKTRNCTRVDRATVLGNPFVMSSTMSRDAVCDAYITHLNSEYRHTGSAIHGEINRLVTRYSNGEQLMLGCWCAPERCHAETIRDLILSLAEPDCDERMDKLNDLAAEQIREEHGPNCPDYDQLVEERFMRLSTE
jgi:hypothetical protein